MCDLMCAAGFSNDFKCLTTEIHAPRYDERCAANFSNEFHNFNLCQLENVHAHCLGKILLCIALKMLAVPKCCLAREILFVKLLYSTLLGTLPKPSVNP